MAYIGKAAEEPIMPFTSVFILARAFGCATTNWSIGGLVEKLDSGTWGTATWDHAVGGATSLKVVSLADDVICHGSDAAHVEAAVGRVVLIPC